MKYYFLTIVLAILTAFSLPAQEINLEWGLTYGGASADTPSGIVSDSEGNIIVVGEFKGDVDLDPSDSIFVFNCLGQQDGFIQKLDENRNLLWAKPIHASFYFHMVDVQVDNNDGIYVLGHFTYDSIYIDNGIDEGLIVSQGGKDIVLVKYDAQGNYDWLVTLSSGANELAYSSVVDSDGNIILTGEFISDMTISNGVDSITIGSEYLGWDVFVVKIKPNGDIMWAKRYGNESVERGQSIAIDEDNNIYVGGIFEGDTDLGTELNPMELEHHGYADTFILKLDEVGNQIWAKAVGGEVYDNNFGIAADSDNNCYVIGDFHDIVDFDPGPDSYLMESEGYFDVYILKLDSLGDFVWVHSIGAEQQDEVRDIVIDEFNNLLIIGQFNSTVDFDPGVGIEEHTSLGGSLKPDVFILKLNSDGEYQDVVTFGNYHRADSWAISRANDNNIYCSFSFSSTIQVEELNEYFISESSRDILLLKIASLSSNIESASNIMGSLNASVFPNPTDQKITLLLNTTESSNVKIVVFNVLGELVIPTKKMNLSTGRNEIPIDFGELTRGSYILRVSSDQEIATIKIVVN